MSELVIDTTPRPIQFGQTGDAELEQNVRMIVSTFQYSVRFDVPFASVGEYIDSPAPATTARLIAELTEAIETQEPRLQVKRIRFADDPQRMSEGTVFPIITCVKKEAA